MGEILREHAAQGGDASQAEESLVRQALRFAHDAGLVRYTRHEPVSPYAKQAAVLQALLDSAGVTVGHWSENTGYPVQLLLLVMSGMDCPTEDLLIRTSLFVAMRQARPGLDLSDTNRRAGNILAMLKDLYGEHIRKITDEPGMGLLGTLPDTMVNGRVLRIAAQVLRTLGYEDVADDIDSTTAPILIADRPKLTKGEIEYVLGSPHAIANLLAYHDINFSEYEAVMGAEGVGETWPPRRYTELRDRALQVIHQDPDCFDPEVKQLLGMKTETTRREVFVCTNCQGMYADSPVTSCDCMPDHGANTFVKGTATY